MAALPQHYKEGNRAFLQAFMARGAMTLDDARPVLAAIFSADEDQEVAEDHVTREDFESYVAAASQAVSFFDYEIRSCAHQATKKRVYALVNTTSDPMTQLATTFTPEELSFTKRLLEAMFDAYNTPRLERMCVNEMEATKLARPKKQQQTQTQNPAADDDDDDDDAGATQTQTRTQTGTVDKGLKHSEVEQMLAKLVSQGWLEKSREGFYGLAPRALLELRTWLVDAFNDTDAAADEWQRVKFCQACKDIVTHGKRCGEKECTFRLHDICEDAFWRTQRSSSCPVCSMEWTGQHYVGERALTQTDAYQKGRRRSGPGPGRRSNVTTHREEDEED